MVEAEKWPGSWYRAKITAVVGDGASYDVEYTGLAQLNARMPAAKVRGEAGAPAAPAPATAAPVRTKSYLDTTPAAAPLALSRREPRERVSDTLSRLRDGRARAASPPSALSDASAHPSVGRRHPEEDRATVSALQDAYATAREARQATLELSQRMERREKAWDEREAHWGQTLEEERALRAALGEELAAERKRHAEEEQKAREVAHDMNTARQHIERLQDEFEDHKEIVTAAIKPLQASADEYGRTAEEVQALAAELDTVQKQLVEKETEAKVAQESFDRLQTESDDQREAIGALMDLLEKTMTVDDASELSDQIDEKIREEVERLSAKLAEQAEAASALGERVDSNAADLMKQIEAVGREAEEEESRLEKMIEKGAAENLATADKITAAVTANEEAASARSAQLAEELAAVDGRVEAMEHPTSGWAARLEAECQAVADAAKAETTAVKDGADEQHRQVSVALESATRDLGDRIEQANEQASTQLAAAKDVLRAQVESVEESMRASLKATAETTNAQVRNLTAHVGNETADILSRFDAHRTELREWAEDGLGRLNELLEKEVREVVERMDTGIDAVDKSLKAVDAKVDAATEEIRGRVVDQLAEQDKLMRGLASEVDGKLGELVKGQETSAREVQQFVIEVGVDKEITQASISRVDSKLGEVAHKLTTSLQEQRQHFATLCAEVRANSPLSLS